MPHTFETQPIEIERFYTGVISARNPLAIPIKIMGRRLIELYDAILSGNNAEISVRSTLQRAAGFISYNTNTVSGVPQKFYAFQPTGVAVPGTILPIIDTTTNVFTMLPGTPVAFSLITKTQAKQTSFFGVGPYLYMGNQEFEQKWDTGTPQGVTNWGIAIGSVNSALTTTTGTGTDTGSPAGATWNLPANITNVAPNYASVTVHGPPTLILSHNLQVIGLGLATSGSILTTQLSLIGHVTGGTATVFAILVYHGSTLGNFQSVSFSSGSDVILTFGTGADTWSAFLTSQIVNDPSFGVFISANTATSSTVFLTGFTFKVSFAGGPAVATVAGSLTATQGYQYLYVYGNSSDGNISNPSPASATIKPVAQGVQVSLTASTDPQVNQIRVFRTTDTGTGAVFFELPTSPYPNITANVTDNAADAALQVTQAVTVGTLAFSPPPTGLVNMEWYGGRMWGSVGNLLYFSAGPDNAPMGNGNSNWPPGNVFTLPTQIVSNKALNGGNGMLSITVDGIHVVQGITNPGFTVNKWLSDVGARTQNAVDTDGSTIYIFTSDRQFLGISANGIQELSQPVSDQTDSFDPTLVYVCAHRSGSQDSRVFLTNGSTGYLPYNLMFGAWEPFRTIAAPSLCGATGSIEIQPGVYKMLMGSTSGNQLILQRDLATFSDNLNPYGWNAIFGNIPLADPTQLANVESVVLRYRNSGSPPVLSILPNDTAGSFTTIPNPTFEPPESTAGPTGFTGAKYYLSAGTAWTQMTHLQLQIAFPAEANQDELLSFGIFPNQSTDQGASNLPQVQGR